jgi:hypothetical protein
LTARARTATLIDMTRFSGLVLLTLSLAAPARAQVHQMICNSVDAPGVSLTALPGDGHRVLAGACGTYMVLRVQASAHGLEVVGDTTFTWAGASAAAPDGSDPDYLQTMRPLVMDLAGGAEPELALGYLQFSSHGSTRGGGVYLVPSRDDGTFGRATHPFRGAARSLTHFDADGEGREDLVVIENGEPFSGHRGAASIFVRGRRTRRIADLVMAPVFGAVLSTELVVASQGYTGETESSSSPASLARVAITGGTPSVTPLPHDAWTATFGDFDGDGATDVAWAGRDGIHLASPSADHVRTVDGNETRVLGLVDLDGTGMHALAFCTNDHFRVATCDASRCWSVPWLGASCESFADVLIADFDGDGTREMLMASREHYTDDEGRSAVWLTFIPGPAMHTGVRVIERPFTAGTSVALR